MRGMRRVGLIIIGMMLLVLLSGCNLANRLRPPAEPPAVANDVTDGDGQPAVPTRPLLTSTPTTTLTPTETITLTPTATLTFTPPPTNTLVPTTTLSPVPTNTSPPTLSPTPSDTPEPTTPTITPSPDLSDVSINSTDNRLDNPGFEGSVRPVIFGEINVFRDWEPFYCDTPYTPQQCQVPRPCTGTQTTGCNPPNLFMRRPEYKPTDLSARVHGGKTAQQWFCFFGSCTAGVFQTFPTAPGETCEVGAYIQSWSNYDNDVESELVTQDDRDNSLWQIYVDPDGGTYAFAGDLLKSGTFGYSQGIYDKYAKVSFTFTATSNQATVFFADRRLWPIGNNDSYIDDAWAYCD